MITSLAMNIIDSYLGIIDTLVAMMHNKIQQDTETFMEEAKTQIHVEEEYYIASPFNVIMNKLR